MEIYVLKNGVQKGPYRAFELKELLRAREFDGDDLGWMVGQPEWLRLREMTALGWIVAEFEGEDSEADDAGGTAEDVESEVREGDREPQDGHPPALPGHPVDESRQHASVGTRRAFLRYAARTIDHSLLMAVVAGVATLAGAPAIDVLLLVASLEFFLSWMLVETGMLVMWGTTPGKALLGIRVVRSDGPGNPPLGLAFRRTLYLLFFGLGLGFIILREIAYVMAVIRLRQSGITIWDERAGLRVEHGRVDRRRALLAIGTLVGSWVVLAQMMPPTEEIMALYSQYWEELFGGPR